MAVNNSTGIVFSVRSEPRLYNEGQLPLDVMLRKDYDRKGQLKKFLAVSLKGLAAKTG
jgi:hypothetical protein